MPGPRRLMNMLSFWIWRRGQRSNMILQIFLRYFLHRSKCLLSVRSHLFSWEDTLDVHICVLCQEKLICVHTLYSLIQIIEFWCSKHLHCQRKELFMLQHTFWDNFILPSFWEWSLPVPIWLHIRLDELDELEHEWEQSLWARHPDVASLSNISVWPQKCERMNKNSH